jgi:ubiquinone/menaquinone biosynthesis C-methylase UbiE
MTQSAEKNETAGKPGLVLHAAATYDLLIWLVTLGGERAFREKMLRLAHLRPGESVLDAAAGPVRLPLLRSGRSAQRAWSSPWMPRRR